MGPCCYYDLILVLLATSVDTLRHLDGGVVTIIGVLHQKAFSHLLRVSGVAQCDYYIGFLGTRMFIVSKYVARVSCPAALIAFYERCTYLVCDCGVNRHKTLDFTAPMNHLPQLYCMSGDVMGNVLYAGDCKSWLHSCNVYENVPYSANFVALPQDSVNMIAISCNSIYGADALPLWIKSVVNNLRENRLSGLHTPGSAANQSRSSGEDIGQDKLSPAPAVCVKRRAKVPLMNDFHYY